MQAAVVLADAEFDGNLDDAEASLTFVAPLATSSIVTSSSTCSKSHPHAQHEWQACGHPDLLQVPLSH